MSASTSRFSDILTELLFGDDDSLEQSLSTKLSPGRYLFRMTQPDGSTASFESHIFAQVDEDGLLVHLREVARLIDAGEDDDLLTAR